MNREEQYFKQKEILNEIRSNATLENWKALSKAYKLGKKIWAQKFSRVKLANDMDMPLTTVLRCLSLDKANKTTWEKINTGKISAFKVSQICQSKSKTYQDEIVALVIKDKLSTTQITSLKIKDVEDVSKEKHRIACENGYSRQSSTYLAFVNWIMRGQRFLLMKKEYIPTNKRKEVMDKLQRLNKQLTNYLKC